MCFPEHNGRKFVNFAQADRVMCAQQRQKLENLKILETYYKLKWCLRCVRNNSALKWCVRNNGALKWCVRNDGELKWCVRNNGALKCVCA